MHGREELGRPFKYEVFLVSESFNVQADDLLGRNMTVHLETADEELRHFDGIVTQFSYLGSHGTYAAYRATLRPWFWLLSQMVENAVYQHMTVPELARMLFRINGFSDVAPALLTGTYDKREYIVQYRESVFNLISRWLEHEGIYYYFVHEDGCHKLCLADDSTSGSKIPKYEELVYRTRLKAGRGEVDHFDEWRESANVIANSYAVDSYDFEQPRVSLYESRRVLGETAQGRYINEAPGTHRSTAAAERYARLYGDELRAGKVVYEGSGNVRGLSPGAIFKLAEHPRTRFNQEYCVISAEYLIQAGEFESTSAASEIQVTSHIRAIEAGVPFRPARSTPRPVVSGLESAVVVGPQGDEISTEEYGRVRVQFHWDKEHERNENSSCWIRVAQPWAGSDFGFQFIPRIGHEVLVEFMNGDPDQPIVVGSVYNHDRKPPYPPNKQFTQSGIRTRSSQGGGVDDYNELRFEDKKGHEEVSIQAQRNLRELVKNDHATQVLGHQTNTVAKDHTETVDGQQTLTVKKNRTVHVEGSQSTTIDGRTAADGVSGCKLNVTGDYSVDVSKTIQIQAPVSIELTCGGSTLRIEPDKISLIAGGQALLVLDTSAYLETPIGAKLKLAEGLVGVSALGGKLELDANASLLGLQSKLTGLVLAQTVVGANSLTADATGVSVIGAPMVKIN